jgi:hypothetical protein
MRIRNHAAFRLWLFDDQHKGKGKKMARDPKVDPTEELGTQLSPSERATRVMQEISGVTGQFGVTDWELNFLRSNTESTWPNFTAKQEAVMQKIEAKVFGEPLQKIEAPSERKVETIKGTGQKGWDKREDDDGFPF